MIRISTISRILHLFDTFSLFATLFLLTVVAFNIAARQIHDVSSGSISFMIPGAIELSRFTLLLIVFAALPRASIQNMVRVDLFSKFLPRSFSHFLDKLWLIMMAIFTGLLSGLFWNKAILTFSRGDATQDLQLPLFYFYTLISLASFATTLSCLVKVFFNQEESK